jgi:hypothetical protein
MITATGLNRMATAIKNLIAKGTYTMGGVTRDIAVLNTEIVDNKLAVRLYFDDAVNGTVTKFQLIGYDGVVLAERPDNVVKPINKGLLVIFDFTISEGV